MKERNEFFPNTFQTPRGLIDNNILFELTGSETKLLLVIIRKTYGWFKTQDKISRSQFEEFTGLDKKSIQQARNGLIEKKLIEYIPQNGIIPATYILLNDRFEPLKGENNSPSYDDQGGEKFPLKGAKNSPHKTIIKQDIPNSNEFDNQLKLSYKLNKTKKEKSLEQQQKDNKLKSDYSEVIKKIESNNYNLNPDSKLAGCIYNTIRREGIDRVISAIENFFLDDWQKKNNWPGLRLLFYQSANLARYANMKNNDVNKDIPESVKQALKKLNEESK